MYLGLSAAKMLSVRKGLLVERPTHLNLGYFQNCFLGIFLMLPSSLQQGDMYGNSCEVSINVSGLSAYYTALRRRICLKDVFLS